MARPHLPPGTFGVISKHNVPGTTRYKARARFRTHLGQTVTVSRFGQTKAEAERRLRVALAELAASAGNLSADVAVRTLGARWLDDEIDPSPRAAQTKSQYRYAVDQYVTPRIGDLRVREATTKRLDAMLRVVEKEHGPGAARLARAVLNGMFGLAVRHEALMVNPVRETRPATGKTRKSPRALTRDEANDVVDRLRADEWAVIRDLPDLVEFALATGCRIGEMLAVRDTVLDDSANTLEVDATAVSTKAAGRVIQQRPKTAAGWRVLALPPFAVAMLRRRREELRFNPAEVRLMDNRQAVRAVTGLWVVFPDPLKPALRDPTAAAGQLRTALDRMGYEWVTFHTFRKTAATRMDEAGLSAREIADQLGHSQPSMTQNVYMGRKVVSARAAAVLDR